jgi:hypothetical protein
MSCREYEDISMKTEPVLDRRSSELRLPEVKRGRLLERSRETDARETEGQGHGLLRPRTIGRRRTRETEDQ